MADTERPSTPPRRSTRATSAAAKPPPTPEQLKRIEENRLKAKARREEYLRAHPPTATTPSGFPIPSNASNITNTSTVAGQKRSANAISHTEFVQSVPSESRDARALPLEGGAAGPPGSTSAAAAPTRIEPARKFRKYIDHDLSAMTDTKGGFLAREDDPFNKAMRWNELDTKDGEKKPAHMSEKEWERLRLLRELQRKKQGPFEPGLSSIGLGAAGEEASGPAGGKRKKCRECGSWEIDWIWDEVFKIDVCGGCKEKYPEKYSLLTKTEVKDDYLLTDEECRDEELLPHLTKPNPHKSHWHDMMLFLRCQVEDYALGPKRWGSAEALDAEFERRQEQTKERKEKKFKKGLLELKRKTRGEQFRRAMHGDGPKGFGEKVAGGRHEHEWGASLTRPDGMTVKSCTECGMEVEEMTF